MLAGIEKLVISDEPMKRADDGVASQQLPKYKAKNPHPPVLTTSNGAPIYSKTAVLTAGRRGPMLMQDVVYMDEMAHFDRERIPERVVHAKGGGAHGYFEVTKDITKYCKAAMFSEVGKQTPMLARFSTVGGESGSADTVRDPRGFALKNPQTHLKDANMVFDFFMNRPESIHQVMFLYSDRGIPDGFRHMDGFGSHTFKMVNKDLEPIYCKFHFRPEQGIKNLTVEEAGKQASEDPDYAIRDLFEAIENGNYPTWKAYIQLMTFEQAEKWKFNPFDVTKVWPHGEYPLIEFGKFVLNRNPENYFHEVEQAAFCPAHVVPGIEFSPDKMLQGRLFSYTDTHFHRLGPNYIQLPINCPYRSRQRNYQRDGLMALENPGGAPNFHPNSFNGPTERKDVKESVFSVTGDVERYETADDHNYDQPRDFWLKVLDASHRERLCKNLANGMGKCPDFIQNGMVEHFTKVHPDFGSRVRQMLDEMKKK
ncbi:unnamed protein product [Caenorhabditis auriculariae]|uniref:Catalase n=1 Tax=Caenorhabditis auriculariae TaxID=2777116 RepID=A0A8S1HFP7_9PELO|nr:unnamed protein product [Caenorhabditis auriculariae]